MTRRESFLKAVEAKLGQVVVWNGKTSDAMDCSGMVTVCLREAGGPDLTGVDNSKVLFAENPPIAKPQPGDLAFWSHWSIGPIEHVAVVATVESDDVMNGGVTLISADGAQSGVTLSMAQESPSCRVKRHASIAATGRAYFRGFRHFKHLEE